MGQTRFVHLLSSSSSSSHKGKWTKYNVVWWIMFYWAILMHHGCTASVAILIHDAQPYNAWCKALGHRLVPAQHWGILCYNDAWCRALNHTDARCTSLSHGYIALSHIDACTALSHIEPHGCLIHSIKPYWCLMHIFAMDAQHWAIIIDVWCTALSYNRCLMQSIEPY